MHDVIQQIFTRLAVPLPDAPEVVAGSAATDACLAQLPTDLLHHLLRLGLFTARDLSALACACRRLASIAAARRIINAWPLAMLGLRSSGDEPTLQMPRMLSRCSALEEGVSGTPATSPT